MSKIIQMKDKDKEKIYPYGINKGIILWTNSNLTSLINSELTINLSSNKYDELIVFYKHSTDTNFLYSQKILKGYGTRLPIATIDGIAYRSLNYINDTEYLLSTISTNSPYTNTEKLVIPFKIIGYKN